MAQSTLNLTTAELRREMARFCGFHQQGTYEALNMQQRDTVDRLINTGLRRFYNPMPLQGEAVPHEWSFLSPTATLALTATTAGYDLPDGFGGMLGPFFWSGSTGRDPIPTMNDAEFMRRQSSDTTATGTPRIAMIAPKATTGESPDETPNVPTIFRVTFWPTPDADGTLMYRYYALQNAVSATVAPPGGMQHAETIIAVCKSAAADEYRRGDEPEIFRRAADDRLRASVWADRRMSGRTHFGMNLDRSDAMASEAMSFSVTVNGIQY